MKNRMGKSRKADAPYLTFEAPGWEWRVLKSYQGDNAKPYARWFCSTSSPFVTGELGDGYVKGIVDHARLTYADPELFETLDERAAFMHNLNAARLREPEEWEA